ncbi:hypothetical protein K469DRAFT_717563 [Zopfia rhizophila CBS 207.26]|uniref:Glutathione S-transferase n=1 Tax=Zopfia rhizophila CBS 207.26 TaxID=1314779 RepID=A0A6A6DLE1_9PEZI|nr:hypothetical protein K469DRAFT_717563 [Zopfia rhizophila CBS 207.26]
MASQSSSQLTIPTLHHLSSSQSFRVLWALEELSAAHGIEYNLTNYSREGGLAPASLKSIHPLGKSPILTVEDANGGPAPTYQLIPGTLTESKLILQFLADEYSKGLWEPANAEDKRRDIFFQEYSNATVALKIQFALVFDVIPSQLPIGLRQIVGLMVKPIVSFWMNDLQPVYQLMEDALSDEKPWFAGEKIGLADFNMTWPMDVASTRDYFDARKYPKVMKWHMTVKERPAYRKALQKGGSYDLAFGK